MGWGRQIQQPSTFLYLSVTESAPFLEFGVSVPLCPSVPFLQSLHCKVKLSRLINLKQPQKGQINGINFDEMLYGYMIASATTLPKTLVGQCCKLICRNLHCLPVQYSRQEKTLSPQQTLKRPNKKLPRYTTLATEKLHTQVTNN